MRVRAFDASDARLFARTVGARIRRTRFTRGLTQEALASLAEVSTNQIARLERGEQGPSLFTASRISEALRVPLDHLLT